MLQTEVFTVYVTQNSFSSGFMNQTDVIQNLIMSLLRLHRYCHGQQTVFVNHWY